MIIKILLADDHKIVRDGLRSLLEKHTDMEVVAEAENGRTAVELARKLSPDVVVMDISMPDLNGIEATFQIISARAEVKVIKNWDHLLDKKLFRRKIQAHQNNQ